ncbi:ankyrin repeat domain-containing protein 50-like [Haliotis rufescens]|uniref:ankyrin repeat domain-containing protein 50-like n=1 Tax=Haliotis rufescens TaxID=6454 RepID=UPI00201F5FE2|nr:ankyrin repeat domain-containing protein 50-like [Haliotis rufescens]
MENVLWYSYFIVVYMAPLYGSTSCQNCLRQKCDAREICTEGCIAGYTDEYCQHPCQETCLNSSCDVELHSGRTVCRDGCVDGYCGIRCKIPCPEGCLTCDQSHCENCTLCRADLYGAKCEHSCLHKCDGFACNVLGSCLATCIDGRHGAHCNVSCQSNHQSCDRDTGQCQQCKVGHFGNECQHLCPSCLTTEEEQFYTCRSGCKVCSSQSTAEPQRRNSILNSDVKMIVTGIRGLCIALLVINITTLVIHMLFSAWPRVCKRKKERRNSADSNKAEGIQLLEGVGAKSDLQTPDTDLQTPDTDLIVACREGNLKAVKDILEQSPAEDINKKGCGGMTPVMWAARRGHREVLDLLVKKEAYLKVVDDASNNILHWACYGGHVAMVKHVVSKNMVDINSKGRDGRTPLMCAAREGKSRIFDFLVSRGGLPSGIDKDGNNILLLACLGGNGKIVKYIISHDDVDINGRGQSGRTPLMAAAYKGHGKVFDLLVDKEADLTLVDDAGDNVLHVACLGGHVKIVSRVLDLDRVDINIQGQCRRTPLMMAARLEHNEIFHLLESEGADASLLDDENNTILHLACEGEHIDMVEHVLFLHAVNINARNKQNETATMLATKGGDVCNLLVSHGGRSR